MEQRLERERQQEEAKRIKERQLEKLKREVKVGYRGVAGSFHLNKMNYRAVALTGPPWCRPTLGRYRSRAIPLASFG